MTPAALVRERVTASPRIRDFLATAIQTAVHRRLGIVLFLEDAQLLARRGGVEEAVHGIQQSRKVKRRGNKGSLDSTFQDHLAVQDAVLRSLGEDVDGRQKILREAIRQYEEDVRERDRVGRLTEQARAIINRYEAAAPELRRFARRVRRLCNKQFLELKAMVRDEDLLAEALAELTQLYEVYLALAYEVTDRRTHG